MFGRDGRHTDWAKQVKDRDNYICQVCDKHWVSLNSHHMFSYDRFVDYRYDLNNGITLCTNCHDDFHRIYGKGNNTYFQFLQFCKTHSLIKEALQNKNKF